MASVDSQFIEEVTAHAQSDSHEDAREICADGTYLTYIHKSNNNNTCKPNNALSAVRDGAMITPR